MDKKYDVFFNRGKFKLKGYKTLQDVLFIGQSSSSGCHWLFSYISCVGGRYRPWEVRADCLRGRGTDGLTPHLVMRALPCVRPRSNPWPRYTLVTRLHLCEMLNIQPPPDELEAPRFGTRLDVHAGSVEFPVARLAVYQLRLPYRSHIGVCYSSSSLHRGQIYCLNFYYRNKQYWLFLNVIKTLE